MRQPLAIGNWKLNGSKQLTASLINELRCTLPNGNNCQVAIAPPLLYLVQAAALLNNDGRVALAAQNVDANLSGAFTGEISARMLKEFAVSFVMIGHSERRLYHQESDALIARKFASIIACGMLPILCIGETEAQRSAGETEKVCAAQLNAVVQHVGASAVQNCVIAYEPVWAIGSGQSASPQQAQAVHHFIRNYLAEQNAAAATIRLLYGGSVNENNTQQLCQMPDIDGVLVGGASLKSETFSAIVHAVATAN